MAILKEVRMRLIRDIIYKIRGYQNRLSEHFPNEVVRVDSIKPILSCVIVILAMMTVVFAKMEVRRLGYAVFKLAQKERDLTDEYLKRQIFLAHLNSPERIEHLARTRLNLKKAKKGQIIQLIAGRIALRH